MTVPPSRRSPDTPRTVRDALAQLGLQPSRRLGQNFLVDANLADAIVRDAQVDEGEVLLEVGPGLGVLTTRLLALGNPVLAVELDARLAEWLTDELRDSDPGGGALTMLRGDALAGKHELTPALLRALDTLTDGHRRPFSLVANLPYAISVPLILELLALPIPPRRITVTVQLEVAERLVAAPGSAPYGAASVVAQARAETRVLRRVPASVFHPRPKVESAIWTGSPLSQRRRADAGPGLETVVQTCFQRRRRQLRSSLKALAPASDPADIAAELGLDLERRPEELPVAAFVALARWWVESGAQELLEPTDR